MNWSKLKETLAMGNKGQISGLVGLVAVIGGAAIVSGVMLLILAKIGENSTVAANADVNEAINQGITAVKEVPANLDLIALIIVFGTIISIVMGYFIGRLMQGGGRTH